MSFINNAWQLFVQYQVKRFAMIRLNSADDAINSFLQMDIDYLLLGDNIYEKSSDFDKRYNKLSLDIFIKKRQVLFNKVNKFPKYNITNYNYNFFTNFSVQLKQFIKQKIYQDYI